MKTVFASLAPKFKIHRFWLFTIFLTFTVSLEAQFSSRFSFLPAVKGQTNIGIDSIDPIRVREFEIIAFNITINGRKASKDGYAITAKNLPEGAVVDASGDSHFIWTPTYNQSGEYEITFTLKKDAQRESINVSIHVENVPSPYYEIYRVILNRTEIPNRGVVRYTFIPLVENEGDMLCAQERMTFIRDDERVFFFEEKTIAFEDIIESENSSFSSMDYFVVEYPLSQRRFSSRNTIRIEGTTSDGNFYSQDLSLEMAVGPSKRDFTGDNRSNSVLIKLQSDEYLLDHRIANGELLNPLSMHVTGELVAIGDLDTDGRKDLIFEDHENGRLSIITWTGVNASSQRPQATIMDGPAWEHSVVGTGDFEGNGVDSIVTIDHSAHEIEIWPFDTKKIERGWVSTWPIPENYQLLRVDDFTGDARADILWLNVQTRELLLWNRGMGFEHEATIGRFDETEDTLLGFADLNGNGALNVILRENEHGDVYFLTEGNPNWGESYIDSLHPDEWDIVTHGYFEGNGYESLLFRNRQNPKSFHLMIATPEERLGPVEKFRFYAIDESWECKDVVDIDGNGKDDMLWTRPQRNEAGEIEGYNFCYWMMDGLSSQNIVTSEGSFSFEVWLEPFQW